MSGFKLKTSRVGSDTRPTETLLEFDGAASVDPAALGPG